MDLIINGEIFTVPEAQGTRMLVWVLRDQLGLTGTKFGCGAGICGSCVVLVDGEPARSCLTSAGSAAGKAITTIEGLAQTWGDGSAPLHPVQQAFLDTQAPQCGYCMSGQMLTAAALLHAKSLPTDGEMIAAMNEVYCRCGAYVRIKAAIARAAELMEARGG